jgi:hypothetical protein
MMKRKRWVWTALLPIVALTLAGPGGCRRDVRLAGRTLRSVTVRTVTHYGMTLDQDASPAQVAYVLLRAIRDDFLATTQEAREAALDIQFDLCAADAIARAKRLTISRDEFIHNVVYRWTPTVSHYVHDFETDWEKAVARFVVSQPQPVSDAPSASMTCDVSMELTDPSGDPNARAVMKIYLAQDKGYWRVLHLGFEPTIRSIGQ